MAVIFEHAGLMLRDIELSDAPHLFYRLTSRPNVMRYLPFKVHGTVQDAEELIRFYHAARPQGVRALAIVHKEAPDLLKGTIGMAVNGHAIMLALKIAPTRGSMGIGRMVSVNFVHWLLAHGQIKRVWAYTDIDNKGVANLLMKIGAKCEGLLRKYEVHPNISDEPRDCYIWSFIK